MKNKKFSDLTANDEKKRTHDIRTSIRFLENLHTEISLAKELSDIQDPIILNKFQDIIQILKREVRY